ncbi:MAG TPA: hypothetical protein VIT88_14635 [Pyrinomonadaceae bacterium]
MPRKESVIQIAESALDLTRHLNRSPSGSVQININEEINLPARATKQTVQPHIYVALLCKANKGKAKVDIKERGIYQLPNGRELFARVTREEECVLYNLSASESGVYAFDSEGRILFNGKRTAWEIDDLVDTGRVASPAVTGMLAAGLDSEHQ